VFLFIVPGFVRIARFHRRENVHQARMVTALLKHPRAKILPADVELAYARWSPRLGPQRRELYAPDPQHLGELGIVEDADALGVEIPGHPRRVADKLIRELFGTITLGRQNRNPVRYGCSFSG